MNYEPLIFVLTICAVCFVCLPRLRWAAVIVGGGYACAWGLLALLAGLFG